MAAYWTVLLAVLTAVIAGVRYERQCHDTCCAGAFSLGSKICKKLRQCSDTGQYIFQGGNKTHDNKCWCDECNRYAPKRPKLCRNNSGSCVCSRCPEGTKPDLKDKNGQYVEHFDKDKHCKSLCQTAPNTTGTTGQTAPSTTETTGQTAPSTTGTTGEPTGNKIGDGIWIGIGISFGVFVVVGLVICLIKWICYCRRYIPPNPPRVRGQETQKPGPITPTNSGVSGSPVRTISLHPEVQLLTDAQSDSPLDQPTGADRNSTVPSNSTSVQSPSATRTTSDSVDNPPTQGDKSNSECGAVGGNAQNRTAANDLENDPKNSE